jgi:hypothetical protein
MAPHLVAYTFSNEHGLARLRSTVLDLPTGPFRRSVDKGIIAALARECRTTDLGLMSLDQLPSQAEHPADGAPYPYQVSGFFQLATPGKLNVLIAFSHIMFAPDPLVTLTELKAAESDIRGEVGWEPVIKRLIPMASLTEQELMELWP